MATAFVAILSLLVTLGLWGYNASLIPDLFKLNKQMLSEGYYSTEFEFRMLGLAYWLDHGEYAKSMSTLSLLHERMKSRTGFIKVPEFTSKQEELEFYQSLQNPRTGAFMDDSYPYCTFEGPTGNILEHIEELSIALGKPVELKYPLRFLDKIAKTADLKAYLDDLSHLGWLGQKLPESSFHIVRDLVSYTKTNNIVERNHLYQFSPEWKRTLLQWLSENQDSLSGYWGPRSRSSNELLKLDLHNTSSIVKGFVDSVGNNLYPEFPLRFRTQMFLTTLYVMGEKEPDLDDQDEWHGWTLHRSKGIMLLTRYLWASASTQEQQQAIPVFQQYVRYLFDRYWVEKEGAFRFYSDGGASLDGTGTAEGALTDLGYFPSSKRERLWKGYQERIIKKTHNGLTQLQASNFQEWKQIKGINSIRVYSTEPMLDSLEQHVLGLIYTTQNAIPDVVEVAPRVKNWLNNAKLGLGNWISRQAILHEMNSSNTDLPPFIAYEFPLTELNSLLVQRGSFVLVGFDEFQLPRIQVHYYWRRGI